MRVIIVDDERLALCQFEMETEDMPGVEVAGAFTNPVDALAYVQEHPVEAAFLDIAMPGMNGLAWRRKLREIRPDLVVIFLTGYEQYTLDALKVKADYYLTKPYNKQDITEALERARLLAARQKKRVYARTFGRFDVFIDGEAVYFPNAKAKELLALCVDHRGGAVTMRRRWTSCGRTGLRRPGQKPVPQGGHADPAGAGGARRGGAFFRQPGSLPDRCAADGLRLL